MHGSLSLKAIIWVVVVLLVLVLAAVLALAGAGAAVVGGAAAAAAAATARRGLCAAAARSPHLVIDGLNATHWMFPGEPVTTASIVKMIDATAPALKRCHLGRVMYVVKDRDTAAVDDVAADEAASEYAEAARRCGVYIVRCEQYREDAVGRKGGHSARGRDDFLAALLAWRWKCGILTQDRMSDFDEFRSTVPPYYAWEHAFWRDRPNREYIDPRSSAYARVRKPCRIDYDEYPLRETPAKRTK